MNLPPVTASVPVSKRMAVEFIGTALLLTTIVGSRLMGERLSGGLVGITYLVNTLATASVMVSLLLAFGPVSGAHLNPALTFGAMLRERLRMREAFAYAGAQIAGAFAGIGVTLLMFGKPVFAWSNPPRATLTEVTGELLATFGLLCVAAGGGKDRPRSPISALALGAYVAATYWFTESTSFANPAVTIAKGLTATSSSIKPADITIILSAQFLGAAMCSLLFRWLVPSAVSPRPRQTVLVFACTEEGLLSRVAAEAAESWATPATIRAVAATPFSSPTAPAPERLAQASPELGRHAVTPLSEALADADLLITLGAARDWRALVDVNHVHWEFPALAGLEPARSHQVVEEVRVRVKQLLRELGVERLRSV